MADQAPSKIQAVCYRVLGFALDAFYGLLLCLLSPWIIWRGCQKRSYLLAWKERWFGCVNLPLDHASSYQPISNRKKSLDNPKRKAIWLHAVSVGEVNLLGPVVRELAKRYPDYNIAISATTATGIELAKKQFTEHCVFRCPLDFSWAQRRVLHRLNVQLIVLSELEIWPNLVLAATQNQIQVAVINGRLSEKSYRGYHRFRFVLRPFFEKLAYVGVQSVDYLERFIAMGVMQDRIELTGNIKFDNCELDPWNTSNNRMRNLLHLAQNKTQPASCRQVVRSTNKATPIFVAGSTQDGEDQIVLASYQRLLQSYPDLRLILVPRHPERVDAIEGLVSRCKFATVRLSEIQLVDGSRADASLNARLDSWQVLLGDTIGDLKWLWSLADIAFVGGSFGDRGGQNMIEPIAYGAAVVVGPNTINFAQVVRTLVAEGCLQQVKTPDELTSWLESQLRDHPHRLRLGQIGNRVISQQRGALDRTLCGLDRLIQVAGSRECRRVAA